MTMADFWYQVGESSIWAFGLFFILFIVEKCVDKYKELKKANNG